MITVEFARNTNKRDRENINSFIVDQHILSHFHFPRSTLLDSMNNRFDATMYTNTRKQILMSHRLRYLIERVEEHISNKKLLS